MNTDSPRFDLECFLVGVVCGGEVGERASGFSIPELVVLGESGDKVRALV